jgi:hypothetical protein
VPPILIQIEVVQALRYFLLERVDFLSRLRLSEVWIEHLGVLFLVQVSDTLEDLHLLLTFSILVSNSLAIDSLLIFVQLLDPQLVLFAGGAVDHGSDHILDLLEVAVVLVFTGEVLALFVEHFEEEFAHFALTVAKVLLRPLLQVLFFPQLSLARVALRGLRLREQVLDAEVAQRVGAGLRISQGVAGGLAFGAQGRLQLHFKQLISR